MTIKATRPGSGSTHPNTHGPGEVAAQARALRESIDSIEDPVERGRAHLAAWDRAEASFPPHLRHGHVDEGY